MSDNEKDDQRARVQLRLDIKNPELAEAYLRAMKHGRRDTPADLLKVILEDWLRAFESGEAIRPFEPPGPPPKTDSGIRKRSASR